MVFFGLAVLADEHKPGENDGLEGDDHRKQPERIGIEFGNVGHPTEISYDPEKENDDVQIQEIVPVTESASTVAWLWLTSKNPPLTPIVLSWPSVNAPDCEATLNT